MKMKMLAVLAVAFLVVINNVNAQEPGGPGGKKGHRMHKMMEKRGKEIKEELNLTKEQEAEMKKINEAFRKDMEAFREKPEIKGARLEALKQAEEKRKQALRKVLDEQQMQKYETITDSLKNKGMEKMKERRDRRRG